jgi:two-component system OmpR family response regulator
MLASKPWKVLIVEDSPETQELVSSILTTLGYEASCCENRNAAVAKMPDFRPDVVLMDVTMPGMSLPEFLEIGKTDYPQTRVVLYSAGFAHSEARTYNIKHWVEKPFNIIRLAMVLAKCIDDDVNAQMCSVNIQYELAS